MLVPLLLSAVLGQAADSPPWAERFDRLGDALPPGAVARFGSVRYRHGVEITELQLSPSGKFLVTRAKDDTDARLWETATGRQLGQLPLKDISVQRMTFLTDATVALIAGDGVLLWTAGRPLFKLPLDLLPQNASAVALSPDGKTLAVGGEKAVHLMPFASPKEVTKALAANAVPAALAFSPDGKWLAAENANTLGVWDLTSGKRVRSFFVSDRPVARFNPTSDRLYCLTSTAVRLLSFDSDEEDPGFEPFASERKLCDLKLSGDGKTLYVLESVGVVHPLDAKTGKAGKALDQPKDIPDWPLAVLAPDGKAVVSRWADQRWATWNPATGAHSPAEPIAPLAGLRLSADGKTVSCLDDKDRVREWSVADGKPGRDLRPRGMNSPGGAAWDEAGERLAYETEGREVVCLRVRDGEVLKTMPAAAVAGQSLQFLHGHPGRYVRFLPEATQLCDWDERQPVRTFAFAAGGGGCAALSPDGRVLVLGGKKDETVLIEVATGKVRLTVKVQASELRFSPDSRVLGIGETGGFVTLVDWIAGRHIRQVSLTGSGHTHLAFSPDGKRVAATCRGSDRAIQVWDAATGDLVTEFAGPTVGNSTGLAYTPDGAHLVTVGTDGCGYVWDLRYRKPPEPFGRVVPFASVAVARAALASADAEEAYQAVAFLLGRPAEALVELRTAVPPATGPAEDELRKWVTRLSAKEFKDRDAARKRLAEVGAAAAGVLRAEAKAPGTPESGRIAADLLAKAEQGYSIPADLLAARAVEAAERIGTPEARKLLTAWADGAAVAPLTAEAKAALARMK